MDTRRVFVLALVLALLAAIAVAGCCPLDFFRIPQRDGPQTSTAPQPPTGLVAGAGNRTTLAGWNAATDPDGIARYVLYCSKGSHDPSPAKHVTTTLFYLDHGLTNGVTYYYSVSAVDSLANEGPASAKIAATPKGPLVPRKPDILKKPPKKPPARQFTAYARLRTWYSTGGFSFETAWVHFKTVDARGMTVKEVLGSDEMNMRKEQNALRKTPKRRQLVDKLRRMMIAAGWTDMGVRSGGEWYEYVFGK